MATFCNLSPISGLYKLSDYHLNWNSCSRHCIHPSATARARISCFCPITCVVYKKHFPRHINGKNRRRCLQGSEQHKEPNPEAADEEEKIESISSATLLWRAIKLPIYSVALIPLTVGTAAAYFQTGLFSAPQYIGLLASSICIISWLNLSNDVYDFDTGADKNKKESVVNMVGSRTGTLVAAYLLLAVGFLGLTLIATKARNMRSLFLLACAITCGYVYQCPPFRLSYQGLGEPLCFAAFGPFATTAFYLMQSNYRELGWQHPSTGMIVSVSLLVGFTTTLILFCSHFHQVEGDRAVGKFSPLVRIGTKTGSEVVRVAIISLYSLLFILGLANALPLVSIVLCALTIPMGNKIISYVNKNHDDKAKIFMAKYYCVRLHALFGMALAGGMVAARRFGMYAPRHSLI